jgi:uncharacterized sporulation protein YeaH/YhbH (DUF444 family)
VEAQVAKIERDVSRFRHIVKGRIRKELKRYMSNGELFGRRGKEVISIPLPEIDIPRFRFGSGGSGGVGQGDGEPGDPLGQGEGNQPGPAGEEEGQHVLEVEVTISELAEILADELELPRIEPKGAESVTATHRRYSGIRRVGPEGLRHFKRTYKEALKRQLMAGIYNPKKPVIVPIREDRRYRSWVDVVHPEFNAVIVYMMDVSGSMGEEQKEIVRIESFWIDTWLQSQYKNLATRYIIHDASAREVDRETFFHTRESGGTRISSAYKKAAEILDAHYPVQDWNIYLFHFSDGDNWGGGDTETCLDVLTERLIPDANLFGYGQVQSPYGSGQFIKDLRARFSAEEKVVLSDIGGRDGIYGSIKEFLGRGK